MVSGNRRRVVVVAWNLFVLAFALLGTLAFVVVAPDGG